MYAALPQQLTVLSSRIAQLPEDPTEIPIAVRPSPRLEVGVGVFRNTTSGWGEPSPIRPFPLYPQQLTEPSFRITQVLNPEEIATAVLPTPKLVVETGIEMF